MLLYLSQLNFSFSNSSLLCIPDSPNLFRIFNWNYFKSLPCHLYRPSPPLLIVHSFSPQNITGGPVVWVSRIPLFPTGLTRPPPPAPQGLSSALCQSCGRGWTLCNWLPLVGWLVHPASLQSAASSVHFFFSMGWGGVLWQLHYTGLQWTLVLGSIISNTCHFSSLYPG